MYMRGGIAQIQCTASFRADLVQESGWKSHERCQPATDPVLIFSAFDLGAGGLNGLQLSGRCRHQLTNDLQFRCNLISDPVSDVPHALGLGVRRARESLRFFSS